MPDIDTETITEGIHETAQKLPDAMIRLIICAAIIAVAFGVLRIGRRLIRKVCLRRGLDNTDANGRTTLSLFTSVFNCVVYFTAAMTALSAVGVDVSSILAVAGVGGVALGFGCQTLVKDVISGLFLWIDGSVKVGDVVTVCGYTGTVENVALRTTRLRGTNGNIMVIPNGDIRAVTNMTRDFRYAIVDMTVAHGQDYTLAIDTLKTAMAHLDDKLDCISEPPSVLGIISSDGRAVTIRIECKCEIGDCWALEREIRLIALTAMQKAGIKP